MRDKQKQLFKTKIVPGKPGSGNLFEEEFITNDGPVECLGMTFENDEKRREYFLEKLREKLKNPEFLKIEGFPIGAEEDILRKRDALLKLTNFFGKVIYKIIIMRLAFVFTHREVAITLSDQSNQTTHQNCDITFIQQF